MGSLQGQAVCLLCKEEGSHPVCERALQLLTKLRKREETKLEEITSLFDEDERIFSLMAERLFGLED